MDAAGRGRARRRGEEAVGPKVPEVSPAAQPPHHWTATAIVSVPTAIPAILASLLAWVGPAAAAQQVPPRDEAGRSPSLLQFRARLLAGVEQRDTTAVLAGFSDSVRLDFGGGRGRAELRHRLAAGPELWDALHDVLSHGGEFLSDSSFAAPYWYTADLAGDPFETRIIIGSNVRIRAQPTLAGPIVALLTHATVRAADRAAPAGWDAVILPDGRSGYVASRFVRSPVGHRVVMTRAGGRWLVTAFVAGD